MCSTKVSSKSSRLIDPISKLTSLFGYQILREFLKPCDPVLLLFLQMMPLFWELSDTLPMWIITSEYDFQNILMLYLQMTINAEYERDTCFYWVNPQSREHVNLLNDTWSNWILTCVAVKMNSVAQFQIDKNVFLQTVQPIFWNWEKVGMNSANKNCMGLQEKFFKWWLNSNENNQSRKVEIQLFLSVV